MAVKLDLRNKIMNGAFDFWQRGTSFPAATDAIYTADRWKCSKGGTMVYTLSRSTDVPSTAFGLYSYSLSVTTAQASITANDLLTIRQNIEGSVLRTFKNKKMVLSFWVKATKTGTYCVTFKNIDATRALVKEYTVSQSNTWEKKVIRFSHDSTGTWNYENLIGVDVNWVVACGTTRHGVKDTWQNGNILSTANQVNGVDAISNVFQLSDVCLVEDNDGETRTPNFLYAARDYFEEFELCQRYFEKTYNLNVAPGTASQTGSALYTISSGTAAGTVQLVFGFRFSKRATPTITIYNPQTGAVGSFVRASDNGAIAGTLAGAGENSACIASSAVSSDQTTHYANITADAEL